jgi:quinol monooxygenase YgiN
MPASPWRALGAADPNGEYVAFLSPAERLLVHFFFYTAQVVKQLASAEGMLGYSVLARPLSKQFWTLSAWKDDAALRTFVQYPPHVRIMNALAPHMGATKFVRWTVTGSQLPLGWEDALRRLPF